MVCLRFGVRNLFAASDGIEPVLEKNLEAVPFDNGSGQPLGLNIVPR